MDTILEWMSKYSPPVVAILLLGAGFLIVAKKVIENAIDKRFERVEKQNSLLLERLSRFEEKVFLDKYQLVTALFYKLVRVASDLDRFRREGTPVPGLFLGKDVVPLTQVNEELNAKHFLLGERFHNLLQRHYEMVKRIENCATDEEYQRLQPEYDSLKNKINQAISEEFIMYQSKGNVK
jgi:hypothetical protein